MFCLRLPHTLLFAAVFGLGGCASDPETRGPIQSSKRLSVDFASVEQSISGFGASSAWTAPAMSDELADLFFSVESGIGLSLLRLRIAPSGSTELVTAQKAHARGAEVWAAPWSPPGEWKTNGDAENGGSLLPEHYQNWADRLADFTVEIQEQGVPLKYLSAQNEPNYRAEWETCIWRPADFVTFVRDFLKPALASRGLPTKIIAPETQDWPTVTDFADPLLADPGARDALAVIATHAYGGSPFAYSAPRDHGLEFWETEISDNARPFDGGMPSALRVARMIHDHLTRAHVSAWHYWWLVPRFPNDPDNSALSSNGTLTRRAYALGNYSKFVRPGFVRVDTPRGSAPGLLMTAFRDPESRRYAVVIVHSSVVDETYELELSGLVTDSFVPWVTSVDRALTPDPPVPVVGGRVSLTLSRESVVTLVGEGRAP